MSEKEGGQAPVRDVFHYAPPTRIGSTNGPGLGGTNHGNAGTQSGNSPNHPNTGNSPVPWINRK